MKTRTDEEIYEDLRLLLSAEENGTLSDTDGECLKKLKKELRKRWGIEN